jgi:uncharacterized protein (DUF111 family)
VPVPPAGAAVQSPSLQQPLTGMHRSTHALNPPKQAKEHLLPSQAATPLVGTAHGEHPAPQLFTLRLLTQLPLQS